MTEKEDKGGGKPFLDDPAAARAFDDMVNAVDGAMEAHGGQLKRLTMIVHTTLGAEIWSEGCDCEGCIAAAKAILDHHAGRIRRGDVPDLDRKALAGRKAVH